MPSLHLRKSNRTHDWSGDRCAHAGGEHSVKHGCAYLYGSLDDEVHLLEVVVGERAGEVARRRLGRRLRQPPLLHEGRQVALDTLDARLQHGRVPILISNQNTMMA